MNTQIESRTVPVELRHLLSLAGALLPASLRSDWTREWTAELWHAFAFDRAPRREMLFLVCGAFADAWTLLREEYGLPLLVRDAARCRSGPVILLAMAMIAASCVTNGFRQARKFIFQDDPARLILIAQPVPFMGGRARIPAAQAAAWMHTSETVTEAGLWSVRDRTRTCAVDAVAHKLLSAAAAQPSCDRQVPEPAALPFVGVVARLKRGASLDQVQRELARTARLHKGWAVPQAVSLTGIRSAPLLPAGAALLGLMLLSIAGLRVSTTPACAWALARIALSFSFIGSVWIEFLARAPFTETGMIPAAWSIPLYVMPVVAPCCAALWLRRDARSRCRRCYRTLAMPVFVGPPGRFLLEAGGTEYLCAAGHGTLLILNLRESAREHSWTTWPDLA